MIDVREIGEKYQWQLAMKDLADGDARQAIVILRNPDIRISPEMREQLASFFELWPPKRPKHRPRKISASQIGDISALYWNEQSCNSIQENAQGIANELNKEPKEIIEAAVAMRIEAREAYAEKLGVSIHTIEKHLKDKAQKKRSGKKSPT